MSVSVASREYQKRLEIARERLPDFVLRRRRAQVADTLSGLYAEDQAELISELPSESRVVAMRSPSVLPETLTHFEGSVLDDVLSHISKSRFAAMLSRLATDDVVELFETLDEDRCRSAMDLLVPHLRHVLRAALSYPEDSAGRLMRHEMASVPEHWSVGQVIDYFRSKRVEQPQAFYTIVLVSASFRPVGLVQASRLLRSQRSVMALSLAEKEMHAIQVTSDKDEVAVLFHKYGLVEAPVVDKGGRLCGTITVDDVVEIIEDRNEGNILNLAGVSSHDFYADMGSILLSRTPWLGLNFLTAFLASSVVSAFSESIEKLVALAVLMPIVASMGGNAGTQTLAVTVRSLALNRITGSNVRRLIGKEALLAMVGGVLFACLSSGVAFLWFSDLALSGVIAVAMGSNIILAGLSGVCIPLVLDRLGQDPAVGSSVLLTTCTDIFGFFSFLGLSAWILL